MGLRRGYWLPLPSPLEVQALLTGALPLGSSCVMTIIWGVAGTVTPSLRTSKQAQ